MIAVALHGHKKTRLAAFHLRQMLGLTAVWFVSGIVCVIPFLGWLVYAAITVLLLVLWVMGLIAAANGEYKPVPVLGDPFQKWFGTAFD